jgi:hypothetical protein
MNEITNFKWDKLVVFREGVSNITLNRILGFEYKNSTDLMRTMIFLYKNKIVYCEEERYDPESPSKLNFRFRDNPKSISLMVFNLNNAVFQATKERIDGVDYYGLIPLSVEVKNINFDDIFLEIKPAVSCKKSIGTKIM